MSIDYNIVTLVEAIKIVAKDNGIKLNELENKIGVERGYLSRVASGQRRMRVDILIEIANVFEMYIDDLFFYDFEAHRLAELKLKKEQLEEELELLKAELENK